MRDLLGQKFGKLTVRAYAYKSNRLHYWWCECECGNVRACIAGNLMLGKSKSCNAGSCSGMYKRGYSGGKGRTREYVIWDNMKRRCGNNSKASGWDYYGKRGIRVCDRWLDFDNFLADMGECPTPNHTIERLDSTKDYCPENCKWATRREQMRNIKSNVWLELDGRRMVLADWARELGCSYQCITNRLASGWSIRRALTTPSASKVISVQASGACA